MEYEEFLKCIKEKVIKEAGDGKEVRIRHVLKNNGCGLDGLTIMEKEDGGSPTIYLNDYYVQYKAGRQPEAIVREILQMYEINKNKTDYLSEDFENFAFIREKVVYRVINYEANRELLEDIPYRRFLDLAVVYYCLVEKGEEGNATALIHNSHMKLWNVTENEIAEIAEKNTPKLLPAHIMYLDSVLSSGSAPEEYTSKNLPDSKDIQDYMYVLTNDCGIHGAACMMYDGVLERFARHFKSNVVIIPSSIHEVLLIPWNDQPDIAQLNALVREINDTVLDREEMLASNVYIYHKDDGMFTIEQ